MIFYVEQQPTSSLARLIVEVSRSHTIRRGRAHAHTHTHPVGLLWTRDQLDGKAATYTQHNKHKRRKFMSSAEFERTIPAIEQPQIYALERTVAGISSYMSKEEI
jgi:hypothetical protein